MFLTDKNIIFLDEVESTNNYAKQLVGEKAENGTVVLAHFQTAGRGQVGNYWESERNKNLMFSAIIYPGFLEAGAQFMISKIVSLAIADVLKEETGDVFVKWPNDVYVGTKKIAGILIENTIKGSSLDSSVIGVGLNLNQEIFVSDAPNPISLKLLTGKRYLQTEMLNRICVKLNLFLELLRSGDFQQINASYLSSLFRYNEWSNFRRNGKEFTARILGVGVFGQLQLEDKEGQITEYMFKEVEFVI